MVSRAGHLRAVATMALIDQLPDELRALFNEFDQPAVLEAIKLVGRDPADVRGVLERDVRQRRIAMGLESAD